MRHPEQVVRSKAEGGSGLTGEELLKRARQRILACNDGVPPKLLDPFAGGGAIPLEGLRLGCEVEASDLNPVAVLILKGTVEYPQTYGQPNSREVPGYIREAARKGNGTQKSFADGDLVAEYRRNPLATDVRYWGNWMLERAREELTDLYPPDPDGSVPVAYLWSRTVPCPNCGAKMPLIRQYWLARKPNKKVALKPIVDQANKSIDFEVVEGPDVSGDPAEATMARGDTTCLICGQVVKAEYTRAAGVRGEIGARLTAVVLEADGSGGKRYRPDNERDLTVFDGAVREVAELENKTIGDLLALPSEPIPFDPQNLKVRTYGMMTWQDLFNDRQLVSLTTFARLVREAHCEMLEAGVAEEYAKALAIYLGLAVDRLADRCSTVCRWDNTGESIMNTFARQALPIIWDYAEVNPLSGMTGDFSSALDWIDGVLKPGPIGDPNSCTTVGSFDARSPRTSKYFIRDNRSAVLRRDQLRRAFGFFLCLAENSLGTVAPDLLSLPLTPKRDQIVMDVYSSSSSYKSGGRKERARQDYVEGMSQSFRQMATSLVPGGLVGVVFAHTDPDAWSTLIEGLLDARLVPDASWPVDTELANKVAGIGQARLKTSVWMACRPREADASEAFIGDMLQEMRPVIRERLLYFWSKGIRGADFFISAIGPALSVFGRHSRVLRPDGSVVTVRDFLDLVRQESTTVALEQVLEGADLGVIDQLTRHYVTWVWSYSRTPLEAGEVHALGLATGTDYELVVRPNSIAAQIKEKAKRWSNCALFGSACCRTRTLVKVMQHDRQP